MRHLPAWAILAAALVIALTAGLGVTMLHNRAEGDYGEALTYARISELVERLRAMEAQAKEMANEQLPPLQEEWAQDRNADLIVAHADLDGLVSELGREDSDDALAVSTLLETFVANNVRLGELVASGDLAAAAAWDEEHVDPSFASLRELVRGEEVSHLDGAARMSRLADAGTILVLMLAALSTALIFRRFEGARRTAALQTGERRAIARSEARFRALVQHSSDVVAVYDADGTVQYLSPGFTRLLDEPKTDWIGRDAIELVHPDDRTRLGRTFARLVREPERSQTMELRLRHRDGTWRWVEAIGTNLLATEDVGGIVTNARDITERKAMAEQMTYQAFHDSLTGLPNRSLFLDRLTHALARAARSASPLSVLFLDLDRFKVVNDSLGHPRGDALLMAVGERLPTCVRPGDTVARLGGDEFAILLEDADEAAAIAVAERVTRRLESPVRIAEHDLSVAASIGIACKTSPEDKPDDLLRDADAAMYAAKQSGHGGYAVFDARMRANALDRLDLEADLRRALVRDELIVYYQPIVELSTGRIVEVEALVRWQHPTRGLIAPGAFIPLAEETGLIVPVGGWVLSEACRQVQAWHDAGTGICQLGVGVNLSPWMLWHHALTDDVAAALAESGLHPECLRLEITEGTMMQDADATIAALLQLRALGVRLAVDDFGTGYSSLAYLQRFPLDVLKIDRAFVARLGEDVESPAIVRAVVDLAKALGLEVTAEGVETAAQAAHVQALGSDRAQGFFYARPLPAVAMAALLRTGVPSAGAWAANA